ncbi:MAG TPA: acetolactate synthase small subunit [Dictyobacter sp.]|jgi:acetolactate synthase-1/3 small subunit|nr:acetolactate synthase small subunit [Dictyobacter sp.]
MTNTNPAATAIRTGYSDAPQGTEHVHILFIEIEDRPGSIDRLVGVLRRKRANLLSLSLAPSEQADIMRVTAQVKDTEVAVDHLVEQVRKIFDVRVARSVSTEQAIVREYTLIHVDAPAALVSEVITTGRRYGASVVDVTAQAVIMEAVGDAKQLQELSTALQSYGMHEIAHSSCAACSYSENS